MCVLGISTEPELNAAWDVFSSFNLFAQINVTVVQVFRGFVSSRKRIVGQDPGGPAEMNISVKSRERCQLNSVVIPVMVQQSSVCRARSSPGAVRSGGKEGFSPPQAC